MGGTMELASDALWFAPGHRRVWDATCLADLFNCQQRYDYLRVQGLYPLPRDDQPPVNPHTEFGHLLHYMTEVWDSEAWLDLTPNECTRAALGHVLTEAWGPEADKPFGGYILDQWQCTGLEHRGPTRRRHFLCDAAKDWWVGAEAECPHCGRATKQKTAYAPEHAAKNLRSLARAVIAYEEHRAQSPWKVATVKEAPGLELHLQARLPGTPYIISGTLDRLSEGPDGSLWVHERKTTGMTPNNTWWASFDMRLQLGIYIWLCQQNGLPVHGAILECFHISAAGVNVEERTFSRSPSQIAEMLAAITHLLEKKLDGALPRHNYAACDHASGGQPCQFRRVCSVPAEDRPDVIALNYGTQPLWNPLTATHDDIQEEVE